MATAKELRAQAEKLMKEADEQEFAEMGKLFDGIIKQLDDAGMGIEELAHWAKKSKKKPAKASTGGPLPAKYKGPNGEMWAGRGHHPDWVVALGKTPEERKKGLEAYAIKA